MKLNALVGGFAAAALAVMAASAQSDLQKISKLSNPAALKETAPATYKANFDTSKGLIVIEVHRDWAPLAADRFYNLVKNGFYDEVRFFRVLDGFMAQFGINGNPSVMKAWRPAMLKDDPVKQSNRRGYVTFASGGVDTRTTQVFINYGDNSNLDRPGACGAGCAFPPFGQVTTGMDVADKLYKDYGEGPPRGKGVDQTRFQTEGNAYLAKEFPRLDYIKTATIAN